MKKLNLGNVLLTCAVAMAISFVGTNVKAEDISNKPLDMPTLTYLKAQGKSSVVSGYTLTGVDASGNFIITKYEYDATTKTLTPKYFKIDLVNKTFVHADSPVKY